MNRRELLKRAAGMAGVAALKRRGWAAPLERHAETSALEARLAHDPRRPQFHLLPKRNWMNDPNGPIYWNGKYHMFFQYNPNAAAWGDMHWAHATSPDMVHWRHLPIALAPTPGSPDAAGCFSGSALVDNGVVTIIYTGVVNSPLDQATIRDGVHSLRESQCLATSTDPDLRTWQKLPRAVIPAPPPGIQVAGFRDPAPWKSGNFWYLALGSGVLHKGGDVLLYRAADLRHWDYLHYVASGQGNGRSVVNPVDSGDMWECPDLFPLDGKHVLIYSAEGKVYWQTGVLDETAMRFHPEKYGILDYGPYYAAKTQTDAQGQRIVWGWIQETRPEPEYKAAGWACLMSLPRVLRLTPDGDLSIEVHPALKKQRRQEQRLAAGRNAETQLDTLQISKATGEMLGEFARGSKPFTLSLVGKLPHGTISQPLVELKYDPAHPGEVLADEKTIPIAGSHTQLLKLHIYVDGSVAEIILQGTAAYTKRFYYAGDTAPDIFIKVDGPHDTVQSLSAWQIRPISSDRLTS
jgi:beta-fructofuranosidase